MASNNGDKKWYKKVFGDNLILCNEISNCDNLSNAEGKNRLVSADSIFDNIYEFLEGGEKFVIALFFSPIEGIRTDESANHLIRLYRFFDRKRRKTEPDVFESDTGSENRPKIFLEVIHVFLTNDSIRRLDRFAADESDILKRIKQFPWYAVPIEDRDRTIRLTRRYQIKSLTPSLILVDGRTGKIITKHGRERLLDDPEGSNFPWKPRPLRRVLQDVELHPGGKRESADVVNFNRLSTFIIGFYFSAHWCPPCKGFTPQLIETYNGLKSTGADFEIIFVSSDRSEESHKIYSQTMPWLIVPYSEEECRRELAALFGVQGIPTLVIVDYDGTVITCDGRGEINEDPAGRRFPWRPKPVNVLTERQSAKLQDAPAVVLFVEGEETEMEFAEAVLAPAFKEFIEGYQNDEVILEFFVACDNETGDILREFIGLDDSVPLLTLINIPEGNWSILEEGEEINEETVKEFVAKFMRNELPAQPISNARKNTGNG